MRRLALVPLTVGVLLFPSFASALGLGEIEMQSALNQRLDAEIPLRGVPEDEADRIIVSLASEEAFRQVGLQRPFALTRLQFQVRQHDSGRHFIHITSREPIVEPFLSFLIEVDWPDGNLLREYTVLLDPPVFVSEREDEPAPPDEPDAPAAVGEESITAAGVPADIERDTEEEAVAEPEPAAEPEPEPEPETAEEPAAVTGDFSDTPVFLQVEQEEERAEAEARRAEEAEAIEPEAETVTATATGYEAGPDEYGPVQRGEALWNIAARLKRDDMTVQQMMLALLRYNPEAFVDDNINRLRRGYVLRVPEAEAVLSLSAQQAVARVREHNALWQEFRTATRTGATTAPETETAAPEAAADADVTGEGGALEIVGSDEGTGASTDESATAVSDRDAGREEDLRLAREQLESARMEKAELESRVDELEETVSKMERLIEIREDQLARLQEQLQQVQQDEAIDDTELDEADEGMEPATDEEGVAEEPDDEKEADATGEEAGEAGDDEADEAVATGTSGGDAGDGTGESATGDGDTQTAAAGDGETATASDEQTTAAGSEPEESESGVVTVRTQPGEPGWLEKLGTFWDSVRATVGGLLAGAGLGTLMANPLALPVAGAAAVLLLLGGLLIVRRRRAGTEQEVVDSGGQAAFAGGMADEDDQFSAMLQSESDEDVAVDEEVGEFDEADDLPAFGAEDEGKDAESALMSEEFDLGDLDEEENQAAAASETSEDETIAEADVYLAYGLHQQAEELLRLALQEQPDRLDYHAKMLETLYGAGKKEEFVQQAETFQGRIGDPNDRLWMQTVAMGKELDPDNPLFQQEVDETLKPSDTAATQPPETDFEIGGEDQDDTDLDFSFDDDSETGGSDEEDDDAFAQTVMVDSNDFQAREGDAGLVGPEEKAGADTGSADDEAMDFDLSDFSLDTAEEETDEGSAGEAVAEGTADSDEDLEFDLGDLDVDESGAGDMETIAEGVKESDDAGDIEFDLGTDLELEKEGETGEEDASPAPAEADDEGTEPLDMDLEGLEDPDAGTEATGAGGKTAAAADTEEESFDFDLGDLEASGTDDTEEAPADAGEDALDLGDFDFDTGETETAIDTGAVEDETSVEFDTTDDSASLTDLESDLSVDEGESGSIGDEDDFDTMLDLARAYIDMGDAESARATLEEVAESGTEKQRNEAQNLLESV